MKKTTKKLTTVVAVLLILVLMTSSIVSGTLAKFVITKSTETNVTFTQFGVTVTFTPSTTQSIVGDATTNGDTVTYAARNITMKPGDDYSQALTIGISGTPNVDVRVTLTATIDYNDANFKVLNSDFDAINVDTVYMPIGFKVGSNYATNATPYKSFTNFSTSPTDVQLTNALGTAIQAKTTGLTYSNTTHSLTGEFGPNKTNKTINIPSFTTGFDWPMEYGTVANSDAIGTYLCSQTTAPSFSITYSVTVEQIGSGS